MTYDEISAPLCLFCKRVRYDRSKPIDTCYSCEAYPDKIPKAIWSNKVYHVLPFEGDHGIMFVPKDGDTRCPRDHQAGERTKVQELYQRGPLVVRDN